MSPYFHYVNKEKLSYLHASIGKYIHEMFAFNRSFNVSERRCWFCKNMAMKEVDIGGYIEFHSLQDLHKQ